MEKGYLTIEYHSIEDIILKIDLLNKKLKHSSIENEEFLENFNKIVCKIKNFLGTSMVHFGVMVESSETLE